MTKAQRDIAYPAKTLRHVCREYEIAYPARHRRQQAQDAVLRALYIEGRDSPESFYFVERFGNRMINQRWPGTGATRP